MTAIHGKNSSVRAGANVIAELDTWSMDINRDLKDITKFASSGVAWKSFLSGLAGATGKLDGRLDMTDTNGQFALWQSFTSDTPLSIGLYTDTTHNFAITIFITKMSPKSAVDAEETVSFDFTVTGAASYS